MAKKTVKSKEFHFGEAFEQLDEIVQKLESGETDLNEALKDYEAGLQLVQQCKKQLSEVENKVKVIREKYTEELDKE